MTLPDQYYERFDEDKNYEEHLFIAGRGLQSAELNELQKASMSRLRGVANVLFKDGSIVRDAGCRVDENTGDVQCDAGAVYLRGAVRGVAPATFTIDIVGTVTIGIYLIDTVVTDIEDEELRDPATGTRNYGERGAARMQVDTQWGFSGDDNVGTFYPIYTAEDGILGAKEPPPTLDAVNAAIARYDRDSTGSNYVVDGLNVSQMDDEDDETQVYSVGEGRARVNGYGVEFHSARRVPVTAIADLRVITNEPHLSATLSAQRFDVSNAPIQSISAVSITAERTVSLVHGVVTGSQDPLPDTSVLAILSVVQGATTYTPTTDYLLTANKVDWSPAGAEMAPGSTYDVTYQYIKSVTPTGVDETGFTVTGAVVGTLVLVTYQQMLPRVDKLCLDADGRFVFLVGVAAQFSPQPPVVPGDMLGLATIYQTWTDARRIVSDSVRVVTMLNIANMSSRIDLAISLIAQGRLENSISMREAGAKKGVFTDPFIDDSQRDAGLAQTAAIVNGELTLAITPTVSAVGTDITTPQTCARTNATALEQKLRTGFMNINPYMSFVVTPGVVSLTPAVDRWTDVDTDWNSPTTRRFEVNSEAQTGTSTETQLIAQSSQNEEMLRQITVNFQISGFGPGEHLEHVIFDGVVVTVAAP